MDSEQTKLALFFERLTELKKDFEEWVKCVKTEYVTYKEFSPVAKIVYGFTGIILVGVATALVALVVRK